MTGFVLILSIITSYGAVDTQRQTGFATYNDCATHAEHGPSRNGRCTPIQNRAGIASAATNSGRSNPSATALAA
jgi:hypothetical protein